jgi:hypothetical protein
MLKTEGYRLRSDDETSGNAELSGLDKEGFTTTQR